MTVCHVTDRGGETRANAEFIVRACNAHEELVEACKYLRRFVHSADVDTVFVDAAIAKAEAR